MDDEELLRLGSKLFTLADASQSEAINFSYYNPVTFKATFHMHRGKTIELDCSPGEWGDYKMAPSKGGWLNEHIRHTPAAPKPPRAKPLAKPLGK